MNEEKPDVKLQGIFVENESPTQTMVALSLWDNNRKMNVAEWFYLIVMPSPQYRATYPDGNAPHYVLLMDVLDINEVEREARDRFSKINPATWDDFYKQMTEYFWNEDDG